MNIVRTIDGQEKTFELTAEEKNEVTSEVLHGILMDMAVPAVARFMGETHMTAEELGLSYEELFDKNNINKRIVLRAVDKLDADTSLNEALIGAISDYMIMRGQVQKNREYLDKFDDDMIKALPCQQNNMEEHRATLSIEICEGIRHFLMEQAALAHPEVEEWDENDLMVAADQLCQDKYNCTFIELVDSNSPKYMGCFGAELKLVMDNTMDMEVSPKYIASICLNLLKDEVHTIPEAFKELKFHVGIVAGFIASAANYMDIDPDEFCVEMYGCDLAGALDPDNENYIMIPVECDCEDDECCCAEHGENCECECNEDDCDCDDSISAFEFLMSTVLAHAREEADDDIVMTTMQLAAAGDPDFPEDWPRCAECGLPIFPLEEAMVINLKDSECPVCGHIVDHDCEVEVCYDDDECDSDEAEPCDGCCPICGRSLDEFPSEETDPNQTSLYDEE